MSTTELGQVLELARKLDAAERVITVKQTRIDRLEAYLNHLGARPVCPDCGGRIHAEQCGLLTVLHG